MSYVQINKQQFSYVYVCNGPRFGPQPSHNVDGHLSNATCAVVRPAF